MIGSSDIELIAFNEGWKAHEYETASLVENPYDGVMEKLRFAWEEGWWDAFYTSED